MSEYVNAAQLADMKLKSLPSAVKNIIDKANREQWPSRKRKGRGGGMEYKVDSLPYDIQEDIRDYKTRGLLLKSEATRPPQVVQTLPAVSAVAVPAIEKRPLSKAHQNRIAILPEDALALNDRQKEIANARCVIVAEVLRLHDAGLGIKEAVRVFVSEVRQQNLPERMLDYVSVANARANGVRTLSEPTLYRWVLDFRAQRDAAARLAALAPIKTRRKTSYLAVRWLPEMLGYYRHPNNKTLLQAYKEYVADAAAGRDLANVPSLDAVRRVFRSLPQIVKFQGRKTGAAYRALLPYIKRDWLVLKPNDVWVGDGHGFKARVAHPIHGQPFKPEVTVILDGATRLAVGWSVSLAENVLAVCDALRHGMSQHGVPLMYYSDNGAGETAKALDHDESGILSRFGIDHPTGIPGNPQGRGMIERFWQTTMIPLAKSYETYAGRDVDKSYAHTRDRKLLSAMNAENQGKELSTEQRGNRRKLPSWKQFLADIERVVNDYNENHRHSSLPKDGYGHHYTPLKYRELRLQSEKMTPDFLSKAELDLMFRPEEVRTVARGLVSLFSNEYFSMELAELHGEKVRVRFDIHDADRVWVYDINGEFVCEAKFEGNKRRAFSETLTERKARERVERKISKKQSEIDLAAAELRPAIEHQADFGALVQPMPSEDVVDGEYVLLKDGTGDVAVPVYKMFED